MKWEFHEHFNVFLNTSLIQIPSALLIQFSGNISHSALGLKKKINETIINFFTPQIHLLSSQQLSPLSGISLLLPASLSFLPEYTEAQRNHQGVVCVGVCVAAHRAVLLAVALCEYCGSQHQSEGDMGVMQVEWWRLGDGVGILGVGEYFRTNGYVAARRRSCLWFRDITTNNHTRLH